MRRLLVLFLAGFAALGLASCGGGGSSKSTATTTPATAARPAGGSGAAAGGHGLAAYLKCLGQHGVDVKKVAAAKGKGGAGAALKADPHFNSAKPSCAKLLAS